MGSKYFKQIASITFSHSTVEYSRIQLRTAKFRAQWNFWFIDKLRMILRVEGNKCRH